MPRSTEPFICKSGIQSKRNWRHYAFGRDPIAAARLGLTAYDHTLGDYSAEAFAGESEQRRRYRDAFRAIDPANLDGYASLDLAVARIDVETSLRRLEDLRVWARTLLVGGTAGHASTTVVVDS